MNKSLIGGIIGGAALVTAGAFADGYHSRGRGPQYADIVQVKTLRDERRPREECRDVEVVTKAEPKDKKQVAGTVVGAVVGGVLGHQIGSGKGNDAATIAGAAAGGYAGNRIQNNNQEKNGKRTVVETRRECRTVSSNVSSEVVGYEVTYRLNGDIDRVVLDRKPRGDRILIDDGRAIG